MNIHIHGSDYSFIEGGILLSRDVIAGKVPFSLEYAIAQFNEAQALIDRICSHPQWRGEFERASAVGPDCFYGFDSFKEQALAWLVSADQKEAARHRKKELSRKRRAQFGAARASIELALIARDGYVCKESGCSCCESLTIDHVVPLSRGGSDDLSNLQFLCQFHNSQKGDRV